MSPNRRDILKAIAAGTVLATVPTVTTAAPVTPVRAHGLYLEFRGGSLADTMICVVVEMSDGSLTIERGRGGEMVGDGVTIPNVTAHGLTALVDRVQGDTPR